MLVGHWAPNKNEPIEAERFAQVGATKAACMDAVAAYVDVAGFLFNVVKEDINLRKLALHDSAGMCVQKF